MKPRSVFLTLICIISSIGILSGQSPQARIKIDTDRRIGEIHPHIFGNFTEHLGRMIYGGIFEEGSKLSDKENFRTDVMKVVKDLNVSILRWPGGNFASGYNWKDGIGPRDQRPVRSDLAWHALESNRFGTDEFLRYCERIGTEPYICVNLGLGTIDDARQWVEYCNESQNTALANLRRKNGHPEPYKVKYWALGNEIDGWWQLGHKNAEDYSKFALEAAKAMRAVDPNIKLVASGPSNYGADWIEWNRVVLSTLKNEIDYIALHTYIGNRDNDLEKFLASSQSVDYYIETTAAQIKQVRGRRSDARPIYIAYDEWNVWYRAGEKEHLEEIYNFEDALAMGMFFNSFFRHADVVKMANLAQMVNVIAPIMTNEKGLFLQPIYFPIVEYGKQRGNIALDAWVSAPPYSLENRPPISYLDVSVTHDTTKGLLFVNVLNRSKEKGITTSIECQSASVNPGIDVWQMNYPDLKATHTFGDDQRIRPSVGKMPAGPANNMIRYTFPAHSLTILTLKIQ